VDTQGSSIAQRSLNRLYFDHQDMDYYFSWIAGRGIFEGSDRDECFRAAENIKDGDPASWQSAWIALARSVEAQAQQLLNTGEREQARKAYLRACTYYRAPLFIMSAKDPRFLDLCQKMRACFQTAAGLFDPPVETIAVPFQGKTLAGYFWKVDDSEEKRPTLIVIGGVETFAEDCYFITGQTGPQRGYNVLTVDLPGQGVNPEQGLHFGAKMEIPVGAVIDYCAGRHEIDAERLAIYGFSWGGHIACKAARYLPQLRAMIANPAMPDVFRATLAQQSGHDRRDPVTRTAFDQIVWRFGLKISFNLRDIAARFAKAYDYLVHGKINPAGISIPALCMAGEGEAGITLQIARDMYAKLPHPQKKLVIFTAEEGGAAHCQVDNLALPNRVMFDWLDEVLTAS